MMAWAICILFRDNMLGVEKWLPVAIFHVPETGKTKYIKRFSMERFLKKALVHTYPDPSHCLRHLER
jgi:hypothetical protein